MAASGNSLTHEQVLEERRLVLEEQRAKAEHEAREAELAIKESEAQKWAWSSPLMIAVFTALGTFLTTNVSSCINAQAAQKLEETKNEYQHKLEEKRNSWQQELETNKNEWQMARDQRENEFKLISAALSDKDGSAEDQEKAKERILMLYDCGFIGQNSEELSTWVERIRKGEAKPPTKFANAPKSVYRGELTGIVISTPLDPVPGEIRAENDEVFRFLARSSVEAPFELGDRVRFIPGPSAVALNVRLVDMDNPSPSDGNDPSGM
ncbi:MAG: hypothetical protein KDA88_12760 [Planctomycetaceae bacterium]|nr:hypothetical protein [Planctomycetaceae bacterium]MCB9954024.1 hypothetical protein [Planctomycetaceae bacterium]